MDDLTAFITARLDEDEATAKAAVNFDYGVTEWCDDGDPTNVHIARHDPARVLREVAAKRAIMSVAGTPDDDDPYYGGWDTAMELVFRHLAAAWSDHPDYKQEWAA